MADDTTTVLQNQEEWDFDSATVQGPSRGRRSIVSVALKPDELAAIAEAARRRGQFLSQFMREAALAKAHLDRSGRSARVTVDPAQVRAAGEAAQQLAKSSRRGQRLTAG